MTSVREWSINDIVRETSDTFLTLIFFKSYSRKTVLLNYLVAASNILATKDKLILSLHSSKVENYGRVQKKSDLYFVRSSSLCIVYT